MTDYILGGGFVGCALKTLFPDAVMVSEKVGSDFPLILIHEFPDWEKVYPKASIRRCEQTYENGFDLEEYFIKSRGAIPDLYTKGKGDLNREFNYVDFNYQEYFGSMEKNLLKERVIDVNTDNKKITFASGTSVEYDRLFLTFSPSQLGFKYESKMPMKIALFRYSDPYLSHIEDGNSIIKYYSNGPISRIWKSDSKAISGWYIEQSIPSILPNNIRLDPPRSGGYKFLGIWPGHIFAHFPERRRNELEEMGVYLVGRNAELNYDRIDETIVRIRKKFDIEGLK